MRAAAVARVLQGVAQATACSRAGHAAQASKVATRALAQPPPLACPTCLGAASAPCLCLQRRASHQPLPPWVGQEAPRAGQPQARPRLQELAASGTQTLAHPGRTTTMESRPSPCHPAWVALARPVQAHRIGGEEGSKLQRVHPEAFERLLPTWPILWSDAHFTCI